jgi:DNA-binding response OmpR family regulator/predicted Ser/Thr protein kinase
MSKRVTMPSRLLVVERDMRYGDWLRHHLGVLCPDASVNLLPLAEFERGGEILSGRDCDVLLLSASFGSSPEDPQARGLELLRQLRERPQFPAIIAVAEEGNELTAVRALQLGAVDYLPKRLLTPERLKTSVRLALRRIEKRVAKRIANLAEPGAHAITPPIEARPRKVTLSSGSADGAGESADGAEPPGGKQSGDAAGAGHSGEAEHAAGADHSGEAEHAAGADHSGEAEHSAEGDHSAEPAEWANGVVSPASLSPGGAFMPANFLPGYTIHALVGESEKAVVYLATSAALGHNVAVKISRTLSDEATERQVLEREYTAIVAIRDPSVVQIYDYGVQSGYEYLVMEYLPRGDLKARMNQGLTEEDALRYVEQIATALQVVHGAGLLHRDLKPPNVMLRENGDVALIDFGLARALDGSTPSTRTGVLRGSPYYMSPEQALGEELDERSDFYSLGIMLYEMLTGRRPYTGNSAMDVLQQHVNGPVPQLPEPLAAHEPLLAKLLAKSREERFKNAEQIIAAIVVAREVGEVQSSAA